MQCGQCFAVDGRLGAVRGLAGLLIFLAATAAAEERGRLVGRVWERGTVVPLAEVHVQSGTAEVITDSEGRFTLDLPVGDAEVIVTADEYEPLKITEKITAGQGLTVEYRISRRKARYESTVRGEARHEGERFQLRKEELHQAPGTLGEPFRVIGLLPGVATPLPLLPVYVIRGASPGTNGFFLDGMRIPQLFHFLVGGGVVHGRIIDRMDFYPGAYDVSFGRFAGGIVDTETRPARSDGQHGEVQLRLYDLSTLGEMKLPKGVRIAVGGQFGYPGFLIKAFDPRADLIYGDYFFRLDWKGLTVEALGSYDKLTISEEIIKGGLLNNVPRDLLITFHRVQIRDREKIGRVDLEAALVGGEDEFQTFAQTGVQKLSLGWRFHVRSKWKRFRLFGGTDGELSRFTAINFDTGMASAPDQFGDLAGDRVGVVAGAFLEGTVEIWRDRLWATLGGRIDVYHAGEVTLLGLDPRLQLRARLMPWLQLNGGIGVYQQPPSFPVPLPGIDTFALQLGLQRAYQASVGVEAKLPKDVTFSITGYYQKFQNVNDVVVDFGPAVCTSPPPESLTGVPATITRQVDGHSFGMELLLRRHAGRFTGWIAYTLGKSERIFSCGLRPTDYDQNHILNVVAQIRLPWRLVLGGRLYVATGRPVTVLEPPDGRTTVRNNTRLPDYYQLDIRLDREWTFKRWSLAVFIELLNLTYTENVLGLTYPEIDGIRRYDMPRINGFRWILPSLGLRASF